MKIGLIAHDAKKTLMQNFCLAYRPILVRHQLCATGTTARMITESSGLNVETFLPGHLGGVEQLGTEIEQNKIDTVIFLRDPLRPKKHEADAKFLIKLCDTRNIPIATNIATAEMLVKSLDRGELEWRENYR